jgi:hypothetical protein
MKFLICLVTLFITALNPTTAHAQKREQNKIIVDTGYLQMTSNDDNPDSEPDCNL